MEGSQFICTALKCNATKYNRHVINPYFLKLIMSFFCVKVFETLVGGGDLVLGFIILNVVSNVSPVNLHT